jgi:hypothetical protein
MPMASASPPPPAQRCSTTASLCPACNSTRRSSCSASTQSRRWSSMASLHRCPRRIVLSFFGAPRRRPYRAPLRRHTYILHPHLHVLPHWPTHYYHGPTPLHAAAPPQLGLAPLPGTTGRSREQWRGVGNDEEEHQRGGGAQLPNKIEVEAVRGTRAMASQSLALEKRRSLASYWSQAKTPRWLARA